MTTPAPHPLLHALHTLSDPRARRGVRFPFGSLIALMLLGLLCRQSDFTSIARWARRHWANLRTALGCARPDAPHATTIARACEMLSVTQFQHLLLRWLASFLQPATFRAAAVDGKTS